MQQNTYESKLLYTLNRIYLILYYMLKLTPLAVGMFSYRHIFLCLNEPLTRIAIHIVKF